MLEPLKTEIPAIAGFSGPLLKTYATMIYPSQMTTVLAHNPLDLKKLREEDPTLADIYEEVQRKVTPKRRDGIADYIKERMGADASKPGAFPALSIGMLDPQEFVPTSRGAGSLRVNCTAKRSMLLDGLGRLAGALILIKLGFSVDQMFTFPVTFFVPVEGTTLTKAQLGVLFHDFNYLALAVKPEHALALAANGEGGDLYLQLTRELGQKPVIVVHGGVEKHTKSRGSKSTSLVPLSGLMRFVRGACEGMKFQESNHERADNPNLTEETYGQVLANLENYLDGIAKRMGTRFKEKQSILLTAPGWQALGLIFHDFTYRLDASYATPQAYSQILDAIARVDWSRHNPEWIGLLGDPELDKRTGVAIVDTQGRQRVAIKGAGRTNRAALHVYLQKKTGTDRLLAAQTEAAA